MSEVRVVLDTNVFVSALLGKGPPSRLYNAFKRGSFQLVSSNALIAELAEVLLRPQLAIPPSDIKLAFRILRERALIIRPEHRVAVCRDPKDNPVLECALSGNAHVIVTGDNDLLLLHPFRGMDIISPTNFLKRLPS